MTVTSTGHDFVAEIIFDTDTAKETARETIDTCVDKATGLSNTSAKTSVSCAASIAAQAAQASCGWVAQAAGLTESIGESCAKSFHEVLDPEIDRCTGRTAEFCKDKLKAASDCALETSGTSGRWLVSWFKKS